MIGIVVTYHGEVDFLPQALASISTQTVLPQQVVVVNDAHPSCPLDLVKSHNFDYIRNATNLGLAGARNTGIAYLKTPYYIPLDADDMLHPDCVKAYTQIITDQRKNYPDFPDYQHYYYSDLYIWQNKCSLWKAKPFDIISLLRYNYISATSCVPKSVWEEVGGYDSDFSKLGGWEDWAFWLSAFEQCIHGIHVPQPLFYRRIRADSMIKSISKEQKKALKALLREKFFDIYFAQEP